MMLRRKFVVVWAAMVLTSLCLTVGCSQKASQEGGKAVGEGSAAETAKTDYNPHDVPVTEDQKATLKAEAAQLSGAVAKIKEFRNVIEEETKGGIPENPYKAHQALDQADLLLQWLPQIARDSDVPKEQWEEINTTANDLRTLFEKVHQNIDDQKHPDFPSVAQDIDLKIVRLEEIAQLPPAGTKEG
ncbi:MAG: hypothetical protein ACYC0X_24430 [Pirellulaceae bacterium]